MKQHLRSIYFFILTLILLTTTAFADMGPKPQLIIRVENAPEELYYLDLLEKTSSRPSDFMNPELDARLLATMQKHIPAGWHGCLSQPISGAPIFGELTGISDGSVMLHQFGYYGVPDTYKILMVTQSGEVFLSDTYTREVLQSSATLNWSTKTVSIPPTSTGYTLQFLATFLPTLLVEGLLLAIFGLCTRRNILIFLIVNFITQGCLALFFGISAVRHGVSGGYPFLLLAAELAVIFIEYLLYKRFMRSGSDARITAYAITANTCTAILGFITAEPLWRFIVSIL